MARRLDKVSEQNLDTCFLQEDSFEVVLRVEKTAICWRPWKERMEVKLAPSRYKRSLNV